MSATNKKIADLLDQREAMQMNLEPLFDGFLLGQGVMQKWRQPKGEETA